MRGGLRWTAFAGCAYRFRMKPVSCFRVAALLFWVALMGVACPQSLFAADEPKATSPKKWQAKDGDKSPQVRGKLTPPVFPPELKRAGYSGEVVVNFVVGSDGKVSDAEWVSASHPGFISAAIEAVKKWQFTPGQQAGKNVAARMQQTMAFNIGDPRERARGLWAGTPAKSRTGMNDFSDFPKISSMIYNAARLAKKPEARDGNAAPVTPKSLVGAKCTAQIFHVMDDTGKVIYAKAVTANKEGWRLACEDAVMKWTFSPAVVRGKPVNCGAVVELNTN